MPSRTVIPGMKAVEDFVGVELGPSSWTSVTQERIDAFAAATGDHQWIHTDVERARRESPWKETVAHGYLTLALAPALLSEIVAIEGSSTAVNSGIEKLRLSSPVPAGSRIRLGAASIKHSRVVPGGSVRVVFRLVFEVDGSSKPVATADVVYVYLP